MAAHRRNPESEGITGVLSWRLRKKGQLAAIPRPHEALRDKKAQLLLRTFSYIRKRTLVIALGIGTALVPMPASTIGLGGGGPMAPTKSPQLISPFGPQTQETPQSLTKATYLCVCDRTYCGNKAISGRYGQTKKEIPAEDLKRKYGPARTGDAATGWVCLEHGFFRCECVADACGNDATVAAHGTVFEGFSTERIIEEFRPWREGDKATGWRCELGVTDGK